MHEMRRALRRIVYAQSSARATWLEGARAQKSRISPSLPMTAAHSVRSAYEVASPAPRNAGSAGCTCARKKGAVRHW